MNTPPILVIAGTHQAYKLYLRAKGLHERQARYIHRPEQLDGWPHGSTFVLTGPWTMTSGDLANRAVQCGHRISREHV